MVKKGNGREPRFCDSRDVPVTSLMTDVAQVAFPLREVGGPSRGRGGTRKPALTPETEACEEPKVRPSRSTAFETDADGTAVLKGSRGVASPTSLQTPCAPLQRK